MFNPLLMIDFYKSTHHEQYPVGLTKMVSYYTPRMSRLKDVDKVTLFGLQAFIKEYLIEGFNDNFFNRPEEEVVAEYERVLNATLGPVTKSFCISITIRIFCIYRKLLSSFFIYII